MLICITNIQIQNARDCYLYTNNFNLYVIELNHTNMATHNDKRLGIDIWAKLFKATTWEEIKMITQDNPSMNSTAESIYLSNSDFAIQEQCRAREDAIAHEKYQKQLLEEQNKQIESLSAEVARLTQLLEDNNIKH